MLDKFLRPLIPGGRKPKRKPASRKRNASIPAEALHTFTVQKAYCVPARGVIMQALEPYDIPVTGYSERTVMSHRGVTDSRLTNAEDQTPGPVAQEATFSVPARRARWAEDLLNYTNRIAIVSGSLDAKSEPRGRRRAGRMPTPWRQGDDPWIEADCAHGQQCLARLHKQRRR